MEAPPGAPAPLHMPQLDGARGIAVLLVLLDHASDGGMRIFPGADMNRAGKYGVYLFFVLSAFLLTTQFGAWTAEDFATPKRWLAYGFRRFVRIFPVYAVALFAYLLMGKMPLADLVPHLLLQEGKHQFWTIPAECKYYLLLPFLAWALFSAGQRNWLRGLAALGGVAVLGLGFHAVDRLWSVRPEVTLLVSLPAFLLGTLGAVVHRRLLQDSRSQRRWAPWLKAAALCAVAAIGLRLPVVHHTLFSGSPLLGKEYDSLICGFLWTIFLLGALQPSRFMSSFLAWAPLRYLGAISFSAYLWHRKFLNDIDDLPVPSPVRLLVFLAIVLAVASLSYFLLERPLQKWRWPRARRQLTPAPPKVSLLRAPDAAPLPA